MAPGIGGAPGWKILSGLLLFKRLLVHPFPDESHLQQKSEELFCHVLSSMYLHVTSKQEACCTRCASYRRACRCEAMKHMGDWSRAMLGHVGPCVV